jgi:hypothetical protein
LLPQPVSMSPASISRASVFFKIPTACSEAATVGRAWLPDASDGLAGNKLPVPWEVDQNLKACVPLHWRPFHWSSRRRAKPRAAGRDAFRSALPTLSRAAPKRRCSAEASRPRPGARR